ncbi:MAG TPA: radical SAM family heme chaperone HemW [Coriobacteriia bacterium]
MSSEAFNEFDDAEAPGLPEHLYFHVPFCRSKCSYCDFNSFADCDAQSVFAVFAGMEAEVRRWSVTALPGVIATVYVGGGTPSLHAAPVGRLLEHVRQELLVRDDAEITVEANPDSLTPSALEALLEGGANRISVGVQAFDDSVLRLLGRIHDARQARAALSLVREAGVDLSVDLICGVPGQSMASWAESLEQALDAGARHVSVYPLSIEEGTPLAAAVSGGRVPDPDPDLAAEMMLLAESRLAEAGVARYEVANYAVPGHESRHNSAYWTGRSYIGTGPGAHGMLEASTARTIGMYRADPSGDDVARVRYANPGDIQRWFAGTPCEIELLSTDEAAREDVMLGLRLVRGVLASQVSAAGLDGVLRSLGADGLTELADGRWRTTQRGWLLGNVVFGRVWAGE